MIDRCTTTPPIRKRLRPAPGVVAAVALCLAVPGCTESSSRARVEHTDGAATLARDTTAATRTDSLAYHVTMRDGRYEAAAMVTFRNTSADTAYFVNCNGAIATGIQRETGGVWVDVWNSEQDQCLSSPTIVPPGDTLRRMVLLFDGFHPHADSAMPSLTDTAVYRLLWHGLVHHYHVGLPFGTEPSIALRTSNRFSLTGVPR